METTTNPIKEYMGTEHFEAMPGRVNKGLKRENATIDQTFTNLKSAEDNYLKAVENGDQAGILKAQMAYNRAMQIVTAITEFTRNQLHIIMELIRSLRMA